MNRVTGIGGVFFKADDPEKMYEWYEKHLGIKREHGFVSFSWRKDENPEERGTTAWSIFKRTSKYFDPSTAPFMINYRVDDLDARLCARKAFKSIPSVRIMNTEDSRGSRILRATRSNCGSRFSLLAAFLL